MIGAVLYFRLLWESFGGWILDNIAIPIADVLFPDNVNILEGLLMMAFGIPFVFLLFFMPYVLFSVIVFLIVLLKLKSQN